MKSRTSRHTKSHQILSDASLGCLWICGVLIGRLGNIQKQGKAYHPKKKRLISMRLSPPCILVSNFGPMRRSQHPGQATCVSANAWGRTHKRRLALFTFSRMLHTLAHNSTRSASILCSFKRCASAPSGLLNKCPFLFSNIAKITWTGCPIPVQFSGTGWHYALSEKGYTDIAISLYWIQHVFHPLQRIALVRNHVC
jgi:hypothetical protein